MQKQPVELAISTAELLSDLGLAPDEPKCSIRELLTSSGQVATVLSLCWMLHILV